MAESEIAIPINKNDTFPAVARLVRVARKGRPAHWGVLSMAWTNGAARRCAVAGLLIAAAPASAAVQVLTFEGLPYNQNPNVGIFSSYGGLTWANGAIAAPGWINVKSAAECSAPCGFVTGLTSGEQIATQLHGNTSTISRAQAFKAISVQLSSAWRNGETVTFDGYLGGSQVWTSSYVVSVTSGPGAGAPTLVTFNSGLIDELRVTSSGGVLAGPGGSSVGAVLDDFTYDDALIGAIPEPGTWALLIIGMGAVGGALRRRRRATLALA